MNNLTQIQLNKNDFSSKQNRPKEIKFGLLNCRSVRNKPLIIHDYVIENDFDILAITESWLSKDNDLNVIGDLTPNGYNFINIPRPASNTKRAGGGVGLLYKNNIKIKNVTSKPFATFEHMECLVSLDKISYRMLLVYKPPPVDNAFILEFSEFITDFSTLHEHVLIIGDFNIHVDNVDSSIGKKFLQTLEDFHLQQHVVGSTQTAGNTLDLVICRKDDPLIHSVLVHDAGISDHSVIQFYIRDNKPPPVKKTVTFRKITDVISKTFVMTSLILVD